MEGKLLRLFVLFLMIVLVQNKLCAQQDGFVWVTELNYRNVRGFSEGLAPVYDGRYWGFINHHAELVIAANYNDVSSFKNGYSVVQINGKYGIIDRNGNSLFECDYDNINLFSGGFALAEKDGKQLYLSEEGEEIALSPRYRYHDFVEGMARIQKNGKWGYLSEKGSVIVEPKFIEASNFSNGLALVKKDDGSEVFINEKGKYEQNCLMNGIVGGFNDGYAKYSQYGKWGLTDGVTNVIPVSYDDMGTFSEGYISVKSSNIWGYVGPNRSTIAPRFASASEFSGDYACVKTINKYGYIDKSGTLFIKDIFDMASSIDNGYAIVEYENRKGIIKVRKYNDPIAALSVSGITMLDTGKDKLVEPNESFELRFNIKNTGGVAINNLFVRPIINLSDDHLIRYDNQIELENLAIGEQKVMSIQMAGGDEINGEDINIELEFLADNLFEPISKKITIETIGKNDHDVVLLSYWFHNDNYDEIIPGDTVYFQATIQNKGKGYAPNVKFDANWPSYLRNASKEEFFNERLMPNEKMTVKASFALDTIFRRDEVVIFPELVVGNAVSTADNRHELILQIWETNKTVEIGSKPISEKSLIVPQSTVIASSEKLKTETDELLQLSGDFMGVEQEHNRFALVIGNENYQAHSAGNEPDVDFAINDARTFSVYAQKYFGIPRDNIFIQEDATAAQMKKNVDKLVRIADSFEGNAELVVFYAGHGQNTVIKNGQHSKKDTTTFLIPVDVSCNTPDEGYNLEELYADLGNSKARKVSLFLDACYSGLGARGPVIEVKDATPPPGNVLVMASCSSKQKSIPHKEKKHGLFTYCLLKTIGENEGKVSMDMLFETVKREVKLESIRLDSEQTPAIIRGEGLKDIDLASWELN